MMKIAEEEIQAKIKTTYMLTVLSWVSLKYQATYQFSPKVKQGLLFKVL
jgi:hypothetical protein